MTERDWVFGGISSGFFPSLQKGNCEINHCKKQNPLGNPVLIDIYNDRNNKRRSISQIEIDH